MELIFKKCDGFSDFYVIERKYHDNKKYFKESENVIFYCDSARINGPESSSIEGNKNDMLEIAQGIINKNDTKCYRCAVIFKFNNFFANFFSPRNSFDEKFVDIEIKYVDKLADNILKYFNENEN